MPRSTFRCLPAVWLALLALLAGPAAAADAAPGLTKAGIDALLRPAQAVVSVHSLRTAAARVQATLPAARRAGTAWAARARSLQASLVDGDGGLLSSLLMLLAVAGLGLARRGRHDD